MGNGLEFLRTILMAWPMEHAYLAPPPETLGDGPGHRDPPSFSSDSPQSADTGLKRKSMVVKKAKQTNPSPKTKPNQTKTKQCVPDPDCPSLAGL